MDFLKDVIPESKRFRSDLARLFILYKYGGIYIDIDQEIQSIKSL
mgnify:CR=1 FL=1